MEIKAHHGQSLIDIAIQYTGAVEGIREILELNPELHADITLQAGQVIKVPDTPIDAKVVTWYVNRKLVPATALEDNLEYQSHWSGPVCIAQGTVYKSYWTDRLCHAVDPTFESRWSDRLCVAQQAGEFESAWSDKLCVAEDTATYQSHWGDKLCVAQAHQYQSYWSDKLCVAEDDISQMGK